MRPLTFAVTHVIHAPSDAVWNVLGNFGGEHRWTKTLSHSSRDTEEVRVGTVRTCRLPRPLMGRREVREILTEYEPGHALAYTLEGAAGPFAVASSRWSSRASSPGTTTVTVAGIFEPKNLVVRVFVWPFVKPALRRLTRRVLRELDSSV